MAKLGHPSFHLVNDKIWVPPPHNHKLFLTHYNCSVMLFKTFCFGGGRGVIVFGKIVVFPLKIGWIWPPISLWMPKSGATQKASPRIIISEQSLFYFYTHFFLQNSCVQLLNTNNWVSLHLILHVYMLDTRKLTSGTISQSAIID